MKLKFVLLSGALALGVAGCMTPMASAPPAPAVRAVSTAEFVPAAGSSNTFEIQSSRLALQHSRNQEVRRFAQQMIRDHNETGRRMSIAVRQSGMAPMRPTLNAKDQATLDSLNTAADFDAAYLGAQLAAHRDAVALFTAYSSSGDNTQLVDFARTTLPTLQMHLDQVQSLTAGSAPQM